MSWREIAEICSLRFGRKPSHHSVQRVLADGPPPSLTARRNPPWDMIPEPKDASARRGAITRGGLVHSLDCEVTADESTHHLRHAQAMDRGRGGRIGRKIQSPKRAAQGDPGGQQ
jgi:hypothetical protein